MRILFINYEFPPIGGGGANANACLFEEYAKHPGVEIDCVTSCLGRDDCIEKIAGNITLYRLAINKSALHYWTQREVLWWLLRAYWKCRKLTVTRKYDLCHAFFGFPSGAIASALRGRFPYLISLRGSDVPGFNPRFSNQYVVLKPLFRWIWRGADQVIANSCGLKELAHRFMPELPISVVPNGIAADEFFPPEIRDVTGPHLLCVSRLVERKGVQDLIEAFPYLDKRIPGTQLTIVGEGDLLPRLQRRVIDLGLSEQIRFAGYVAHDQLPQMYRQADVFVQPSFYEGMSNTVLEAMASGLPIVATGQGGVEELCRENARMVRYADPQALAKVLAELLADRAKCQEMGEISRTIALDFSWAKVAGSYLRMYDEMLSKKMGGH